MPPFSVSTEYKPHTTEACPQQAVCWPGARSAATVPGTEGHSTSHPPGPRSERALPSRHREGTRHRQLVRTAPFPERPAPVHQPLCSEPSPASRALTPHTAVSRGADRHLLSESGVRPTGRRAQATSEASCVLHIETQT